jgi:20S proteasome subunit alpha 6
MTQEMVACAIGARSQMARTYLERNLEEFADCDREKLVVHGLRALKESLAQDKDLSVENTSIGIVGIKGKGMKGIDSFKLFDGQEVRQWIEMAAEEKESGEGADAETAAAGESMEVDS